MEKKGYIERPWGTYYKLHEEPGVWVKRIEVNPGERLSLQTHAKRSEKWIVVAGHGLAIVNGKEIPLAPGSVVDVPVNIPHRLGNNSQRMLVIIEIATGEYLGEDDIVRLQDDYLRS